MRKDDIATLQLEEAQKDQIFTNLWRASRIMNVAIEEYPPLAVDDDRSVVVSDGGNGVLSFSVVISITT